MSPIFSVDQRQMLLADQRQNNLDICMYKMLLATREHNIDINDLTNVLCDVITTCDNENITDLNEICEKIKDKIYGAYHIDLNI